MKPKPPCHRFALAPSESLGIASFQGCPLRAAPHIPSMQGVFPCSTTTQGCSQEYHRNHIRREDFTVYCRFPNPIKVLTCVLCFCLWLKGRFPTFRARSLFLCLLLLLSHHKVFDNLNRSPTASLTSNSPSNLWCCPIYHYVHVKTRMRRAPRSRAKYVNLRLEEKVDCIYRLPPPGNTQDQTDLHDFWGQRPKTKASGGLKVLQWNANSLNLAKAAELSQFWSEHSVNQIGRAHV